MKCWYCNEELRDIKVKVNGKSVQAKGCFNKNCLADREYTTVIAMKNLKECYDETE